MKSCRHVNGKSDELQSTNSRNYEVLQTSLHADNAYRYLLIVEIMKSCRRADIQTPNEPSTNSRNYEVLQT